MAGLHWQICYGDHGSPAMADLHWSLQSDTVADLPWLVFAGGGRVDCRWSYVGGGTVKPKR